MIRLPNESFRHEFIRDGVRYFVEFCAGNCAHEVECLVVCRGRTESIPCYVEVLPLGTRATWEHEARYAKVRAA